MEIDLSIDSLPVFEALASDTRLSILNNLSSKDKNIKELSQDLFMSSAIVSRHIKKLEEANLIRTYTIPAKSGTQKMCTLTVDHLSVVFPRQIYSEYNVHKYSIKLGHYYDYEVYPTCGLASKHDIIGSSDDARYFMDSARMNADIIWFSKGFVEYRFPNVLEKYQKPEVLEFTMEISSEFPGSNNNWPSDLTFYINEKEVGTWTVPGNYSDVRGKLTPDWWPDTNSQYGLLKTLRINSTQTNMDGDLISTVSIDDLSFQSNLITLRIAIKKDAENSGGLTIFGRSFGNHAQDINYNLYYTEEQKKKKAEN